MAKSRSESPLRNAEGKRTMPGPGTKANAFRHCEEHSDEAISNGQPEMRQA